MQIIQEEEEEDDIEEEMDIPFLPSHTLEPTRTLSRASSRSSNGGPRTSSRLSTQEEGRPDSRISNADVSEPTFTDLSSIAYSTHSSELTFSGSRKVKCHLCAQFLSSRNMKMCACGLYMHKKCTSKRKRSCANLNFL